MKNYEEGMDKLLTIEKSITGMIELHRLVVELKELESYQQKTIQALQMEEKKYRTFLGSIPLRLFIKDRNSRYLYCSEKYGEDLKIRPEEIVGKTDSDYFPEELAKQYITADKRIIETGGTEDMEGSYISGEQKSIIHVVRTPLRDENGEVTGVLGVFWDITEQKRREEESRKHRATLEELLSNRTAEWKGTQERLEQEIRKKERVEDQLRQTEEKLRIVFESTGIAVAMVGEEDRIISQVNSDFTKLFGLSKEEIEKKKDLTEMVIGDDLKRMKEELLAGGAREEGTPKSQEYRFMDKEGNIKPISMDLASIPGTQTMVACLSDLTEWHRLREALQISEDRHRSLVENANMGIHVIQDGRFKFINPKSIEIFGYSREELDSRPVLEIVHADDREKLELRLMGLEGDGPYQAYSFRIVQKDNTFKWLENKMALIQWEGRPASLHFVSDVTAIKQAIEELCESIKPFRGVTNSVEKIHRLTRE